MEFHADVCIPVNTVKRSRQQIFSLRDCAASLADLVVALGTQLWVCKSGSVFAEGHQHCNPVSCMPQSLLQREQRSSCYIFFGRCAGSSVLLGERQDVDGLVISEFGFWE